MKLSNAAGKRYLHWSWNKESRDISLDHRGPIPIITNSHDRRRSTDPVDRTVRVTIRILVRYWDRNERLQQHQLSDSANGAAAKSNPAYGSKGRSPIPMTELSQPASKVPRSACKTSCTITANSTSIKQGEHIIDRKSHCSNGKNPAHGCICNKLHSRILYHVA